MTHKRISILFSLVLTFLLLGCDNELDVNADYEETMVVYGLLEYGKANQYIKINKAYLSSNRSAYEDAQIADSSYYDSLTAKLIDSDGNQIPLFKTSGPTKDSGLFNNSVNTLYTTNAFINPTKDYRIEVESPVTKAKVTSSTSIVHPPFVSLPFPNNKVKWLITPSRQIPFRFFTGKNSIIYDIVIRFHYQDILKSDTNVKVDKYLDWKAVKDKTVSNAKGGIMVTRILQGSLFFDILEQNIPVDDDLFRRAISADILFYGGGVEINNYISVSKPSIGIVQKTSNYSNIENGIGIFSSRNVYSITDIEFSQTTLDYFRTDTRTRALNFIY